MHRSTSNWTYLSNHAHVLICLADDPDARLRDVAARVGITERAVQSIVTDLEANGAITRIREGRRNHYEIHRDATLWHSNGLRCSVQRLLSMVGTDADQSSESSA